MATPTPGARAQLDAFVQELARLGNGLTLDDFRSLQIRQSARTALRMRFYIIFFSIVFMALAIFVLLARTDVFSDLGTSLSAETGAARERVLTSGYSLTFAALWALALGGLGAVANIFIHMLKLVPQETLRTSDEFELFGRIILGCLFSVVLTVTVVAAEMTNFFTSLRSVDKIESNVTLLLPFLAGYSIPLVLGLLEKAIRAVELTIGLEDRRDTTARRGRRAP